MVSPAQCSTHSSMEVGREPRIERWVCWGRKGELGRLASPKRAIWTGWAGHDCCYLEAESMEVSPLYIVVRVFISYFALIAIVRVTGRTTLSKLRPIDLLTMLLMSETVGPALTGGDSSLGAGVLAAASLCCA